MTSLPCSAAVGTSFTFQGRMLRDGAAVTGVLDFEIELYDAAAGGASVGGPVALADVSSTDGLFTVSLDFGSGAFDGDPRWLEIRVSPDFPATAYTVLAPRRQLLPAPYAFFATDATQAVDALNAVNATLAGDAANAANASLLDGLDSTAFALATHAPPLASAIGAVADGLVVFGAAGGSALAGDAGGLTYDSLSNDLTGAADVDVAGVYRLDGESVLRVVPALDGTFVGLAGAAAVTVAGNTALGDGALAVAGNTAVGANALADSTTAAANTAVGFDALASNTLGGENTAVGSGALATNVGSAIPGAGSRNSAFGSQALHDNTGGDNTAAGAEAMARNKTGSSNTAVGAGALDLNHDGSRNTAFGSDALGASFAHVGNTGVGYRALNGGSTGAIGNTAVGEDALQISRGADNTAVGHNAADRISTGTDNLAIGVGSLGESDSGNISIGHLGVNGDNLKIRIGRTQHTETFVAGIFGSTVAAGAVAVVVDSNGQLGTTVSSLRFKEAVSDLGVEADRLLALRPVTFRYRAGVVPPGDPRPVQFGLIAEEVATVAPDWAVRDREGNLLTVRYEQVNAALLGLVQRQRQQIDGLADDMDALAERLRRLEVAAQAPPPGGTAGAR